METRKNQKYDLESKRPLFFSIGLCCALLLAISAFEWKSEISYLIIEDPYEEEPSIIFIPTQVTTIPEPPRPKVDVKPVVTIEPKMKPFELKEKKKEELEEPVIIQSKDPHWGIVEIPEVPDEAPKNFAEVMPSYDGGLEEFYQFIGEKIRYPNQALRIGTEGKVFVQFIVEKDGSLSNIKVLKGIGSGCDEEALRVMKLVDGFSPGKQGDLRVRVRMVVPISFVLH